MAVVVRLTRFGRKNRPFYRIVAMERRKPCQGRYLENLGVYDPWIQDPQTRVTLNRERYQYWLKVGAKPSQTVEKLVQHVP